MTSHNVALWAIYSIEDFSSPKNDLFDFQLA